MLTKSQSLDKLAIPCRKYYFTGDFIISKLNEGVWNGQSHDLPPVA